MTVVLSAGTTGPDPSVHEIVHFGAVLCSDDFRTVLSRFSVYVRAERPDVSDPLYLERAGFASVSSFEERSAYYKPAGDVWASFVRLLLRHDAQTVDPSSGAKPPAARDRAVWSEQGVGAGGAGLQAVLARTHIACFNAPLEAPFLGTALRDAGFPVDFESMRRVTSLCGLMLDYVTGLRYFGAVREPQFEFENTLTFFGASCRRPTDALLRADAVRQAYQNHFTSIKTIYDAASKWHGGERRDGTRRRA